MPRNDDARKSGRVEELGRDLDEHLTQWVRGEQGLEEFTEADVIDAEHRDVVHTVIWRRILRWLPGEGVRRG